METYTLNGIIQLVKNPKEEVERLLEEIKRINV